MNPLLWQPSPARIAQANITAFRHEIEQNHRLELPDYAALHHWSVAQPGPFWRNLWDYTDVIGDPGETLLTDSDKMPGAQWFPDARLNFAENLLRRRDDETAIVFWGEDKLKRSLSYNELYDRVARLTQALRAMGVHSGDRVAGYLPNMPETVIAMLATTSIGAIWSSCSPDFGVRGVIDRFGQIEPKVLFSADGYYYNGKSNDCLGKLNDILAELPTVEQLIVVPYAHEQATLTDLVKAQYLDDVIAPYAAAELRFEQLPFDHPICIMFSSGTTGAPKCIVHGAGGTLLQHLKEHQLHTDIKPGDRLFYFTTCGWMMWNWLVSGLASGATLLLYDGSPFYPSGQILFDYADSESMTVFGTSAKFIDALNKSGLKPGETHSLASVQMLLSTGSPLTPESFDYVYRSIKQELCLASIAGGTDIISCFVLGNPTLPVYRGEIQCRGLGMKVEVWNDQGKPVRGEKGELVCAAPFPSMPIGFWNDPNGQRYHAAYFERFPGVWHHGDYVELTEQDGLIIHGRSDAVLNPGGVRIGTAEIYRQVEQLAEVLEALVIGQDWDDDVRVVLFVRLQEGHRLDEPLVEKIRTQIRQNTTPRHVPAKVIQVADIPRTKSGKIVELAVRDLVHGRTIRNIEALANPEALDLFCDLAELQS
jgi:acetoacetyl-CoA synthetase